MKRTAALLPTAIVVLASCGGGDEAVEFDSSVTFLTVPGSNASAPPTAVPLETSDGSTTTGAPTTLLAATTLPATTTLPTDLVDPAVSLVEVGQFDQPVDVAIRPLDNRLFVIEQSGSVIAVDDESTAEVLDVSDRIVSGGEQGLLGLAFHPAADFAYVNYTDRNGNTVVAEFAVDPATGVFDPASFREVLTVEQPFSNHNGGKLEFGPDGYLYVGLGDGGSGGDPNRYSLDLSSRLGKILRIDPRPTATEPFSVPPNNPFVATVDADPTIWSVGLRNPWRFAFDPATGDLWIADVGQNEFEEINRAPATGGQGAGGGLSFGWSAFEADERFNDDQSDAFHTAPVYSYDHAGGRCSVSGGAVARGDLVPNLAGWYVFGDYCSGEIWGLDPSSVPGDARIVDLARLESLAAISEGPDGALYAISNSGIIARFAPA